MPNHIRNQIISSKEVIDSLYSEQSDVDFNTIEKMPDTLDVGDIRLDIETMASVALNLTPQSQSIGMINRLKMLNRENSKSPTTLNDDDWHIFMAMMQNYKDHGFMHTLDFAKSKWGTKWNAYNIDHKSDTCVEFDTAWNGVTGLMQVLSSKFPSTTIHYTYADEDTGSNTAQMTILGGKCIVINKPMDSSVEAYHLAFKLRPCIASDYKLVNGSYEYVDG